MELDIPVIKMLFYRGRFFVYDAYNNNIFQVNRDLYKEIGMLLKIGINKYKELHKDSPFFDDVMLLLYRGYLHSTWVETIEHPESEYINLYIRRGIRHLVLQLTQGCNFVCRYCLTTCDNGIKNFDDTRHMTWKIAQKSIDYLFDHSKDRDCLTIAFYGGEPLLNFDVLKKVVLYCEQKFEIKKISYLVTTNGSLLVPPIIDFLEQHDVNIMVSFDGPADIQNKQRKFKTNGIGTYDVVWKNINRIRALYPDWFNKNVRFHATLLPGTFENDVIHFFDSNNIDRDKLTIRYADMDGIDYPSIVNPYNTTNNNHVSFNYDNSHFDEYETLVDRKGKIGSTWHHDGVCVPAKYKIFVDVNGDIYPCEKVCNSICNKIGDLDYGIDPNKVYRIINIGEYTKNECMNCYAMRFCRMCIKRCYDPELNSNSSEQKKRNCEKIKQKAFKYLTERLDKVYTEDIECRSPKK